MTAELKPCPFCRCIPDGYEGRQVSCRCGAMGPIETPNDPESAGWNDAHDILQSTIAADWQSEAMHQNRLLHDALTRAEVAEARLAKAAAAIRVMMDEAEYPDEVWKIGSAVLAELEKTK